MIDERRSYVAGRWVDGDEAIPVENPADESQVAELAVTPLPEFERAITEARRAFDEGAWADRMAPTERARRVHALLDHVEASGDGARRRRWSPRPASPTMFAEGLQLAHGRRARPGRRSTSTCRWRTRTPTRSRSTSWCAGRVALSVRRHEPVGVVAAITPYNAAVIMAFQKLIPALMAGNSVILRPSPLTPDLVADLRRGGRGGRSSRPACSASWSRRAPPAPSCSPPTPRSTWCRSPGRPRSGKQILAQAAPTVKRVALELGGKSAQIYLPDAVDRVAARGDDGRRR